MLVELPETHREKLSHEKPVQMEKVKVSKETTHPTNTAESSCQDALHFFFLYFKGELIVF